MLLKVIPDDVPDYQALLQAALTELPEDLRSTIQRHLPDLQREASFQQRVNNRGATTYRLRTRVYDAEGRRRQIGISLGEREALAQLVVDAMRHLRSAQHQFLHGAPLTSEQRAQRLADRQKRTAYRRLFYKVSHASRQEKRQAWHGLVADGVLMLNDPEIRQRLWQTVLSMNPLKSPTIGDQVAINGPLLQFGSDQEKLFHAPDPSLVAAELGQHSQAELSAILQSVLEPPSKAFDPFAPASRQGDELAGNADERRLSGG